MKQKARRLCAKYVVVFSTSLALAQQQPVPRCVIADVYPSAGDVAKNVKLYCGPHSAGAAGVMSDANLGFVRTISDVQHDAPFRTLRLDRVSKIDIIDMSDEEKKVVAAAEAVKTKDNGNFFSLHWQKVDITFADPATPALKGVFTYDGCSVESEDKQSSLKTRVEALHPKTIQIQSKMKCTL